MSKGLINSWEKLEKFQKPGNRIVVMWPRDRPSVLQWTSRWVVPSYPPNVRGSQVYSWRDRHGQGYAIDISYPIYKVSEDDVDGWDEH
jgi:hypothetical protein